MLCTLSEEHETAFQKIYEQAYSGLDAARNAKIGLLASIKLYKKFAMAKKAVASKCQVAAQIEGLSGSPCDDLTPCWERLDRFRSRLHPKELEGNEEFCYDLQMVPDSVSWPLEYELNTDSNRFPQTPTGLKDWIYKPVDVILGTMGNEDHNEWRRTVRDSPWRLDGMDYCNLFISPSSVVLLSPVINNAAGDVPIAEEQPQLTKRFQR